MTIDDEYEIASQAESDLNALVAAMPGADETRFTPEWRAISTALTGALEKLRALLGKIEKWEAGEP